MALSEAFGNLRISPECARFQFRSDDRHNARFRADASGACHRCFRFFCCEMSDSEELFGTDVSDVSVHDTDDEGKVTPPQKID